MENPKCQLKKQSIGFGKLEALFNPWLIIIFMLHSLVIKCMFPYFFFPSKFPVRFVLRQQFYVPIVIGIAFNTSKKCIEYYTLRN